MADNGLRDMDNVSQQATDDVKNRVGNKAKRGAQKLANKAGKKAGKAVKKGATKAARAASKVIKKAAAAVAKLIATIIKTLVAMIVKLLILLAPYLVVVLAVVMVFTLIWDVTREERGSAQVNDFNPAVANPSVVDEQTAAITALAMTEPQAVVDAYYKFMATQSFTKEYGNKLYSFANEDETADFSALRDYYETENYFYLSDDFIRMVDETLHENSFYYPEQIIKPVFGKRLTVVDKNGNEESAYTSLLPSDYKSGEKSIMFEDNFSDPKDSYVKDFDKMVTDRSQLDNTDVDNASDEVLSLIAKSQKPTEHVDTEAGREGMTYYSLTERNVVDDSGTTDLEPGLWDYGFGSVLQYEPHKKIQYITCSYTSVDIDIDYRTRTYSEEYGWSGWSDWTHSNIYEQSLEHVNTKADLDSLLNEYTSSLEASASSSTVEYDYRYQCPTNIDAILSDTTEWKTYLEPNAANEATLNRAFNNSHIDMKVEGVKDIEISRLEFSDELDEFANHGTSLYPLNIALINHAATFSGNIHYTIIPAGEAGCSETRTELQANTTAVSDHREPVKTIKVAGGCPSAQLTATREGEMVVQMPKVEETDSPWGFSYIQMYADQYSVYVPNNYMTDRDFFLRTGLKAVESKLEGTAGEEENKEAQQYVDNLQFLIDLGLLRPYAGGDLSAMGMVDIKDMETENSDLYILAKCIAAEAANNKLDELLVGATFVNRVHGNNSFPDTYWEVLTSPGQYACYSSGSWAKANPTDSEIASAMQVMTGQFALPQNVVFQAQFTQGNGIFMTNDVHYYCWAYDSAPSATDLWGRTALSPEQLRSLASKLDGTDPNEISGEGINFDASKAVFIGDSLTVGLNSAKKLTSNGASVIAQTGAGIDQIRELVQDSDASLWTGKEVAYVLAGTNSCTDYESVFTDKYNRLIDAIYAKSGSIKIIVVTMPPVVDGRGHNASNSWIKTNNQSIQKVAQSKGLQIIDLWSLLQKEGSLSSTYDSGDGLHLSNAGYTVWYSLIRGGLTTTTIDDGMIDFSGTTLGSYDIKSDYRLYQIEEFDLLDAVNMQAHLGTEDETARTWLESLGAWFVDKGSDFIDLIGGFFEAMGDLIFPSPNTTLDKCFYAASSYNINDIESIVYSTITFNTQATFGTVEDAYSDEMKDEHRIFLFVGKNAIKGIGTVGQGGGMQLVPGTGTTIDGIISPTSTYYPPLNGYNGTYIEYQVPVGTKILAVGDGKILEVDNVGSASSSSKGKYVIQEIQLDDGRIMQVTYGNLSEVSVSAGSTVSSGSQIGLSGTNQDGTASLYFSVSIDGAYVDPSTIFYQPSLVYGAGSLGKNLNNADGSVNKEALAQLREELNALVGLTPNDPDSNPYDPSDFDPAGKMVYLTSPMNQLQPLQCTWWARGRGLQYVMTFYPGRITYSQFNGSNKGNGGEVYANAKAAGIFGTGTVPKPNSLVSMSSGSSYGHVAYVEAIDTVNKVFYISEAGSGNYWGSVRMTGISFNDPRIKGFVYLDEILI